MLNSVNGKLNFPMFTKIITEIITESESLAASLTKAFEDIDEDLTGLVSMSLLEQSNPGISEQVLHVIVPTKFKIEVYSSHINYRQLLNDNSVNMKSMENLMSSSSSKIKFN